MISGEHGSENRPPDCWILSILADGSFISHRLVPEFSSSSMSVCLYLSIYLGMNGSMNLIVMTAGSPLYRNKPEQHPLSQTLKSIDKVTVVM